MQRAIRRGIVREYARESGITKINRRLRRLVGQFITGTAWRTKDIRRIEQRRDLNMKKAHEAAQVKRASRWARMETWMRGYNRATARA